MACMRIKPGQLDILNYNKNGANITLQDKEGNTCLHWASRMGWGSMLVSMINTYRKRHPTQSKGVLQIMNSRGRTCLEVAKNETVAELVSKRFEDEAARARRSEKLQMKFKVGAKKMIRLDGGLSISNIKNQHRRYGSFNSKRENGPTKGSAVTPKYVDKMHLAAPMEVDLCIHDELNLTEFAYGARRS